MSRLGRAAGGLAAVAVALALGLAIAILVWGYTALPVDLSPPDPASVPATVRALFWAESGGSSSEAREFGSAERVDRSVCAIAARALLARERRPLRQLREALANALAARWIRHRWSAEQALAEIALRSYYAHNHVGLHAASLGYFGVPADALTVAQAAALVVIPSSPERYSPWCHPDRVEQRAVILLASFDGEKDAAPLEGLLPATGACPPGS